MITKNISTRLYEDLVVLIESEIRRAEGIKDAQRQDRYIELEARRAASQCYNSVCASIEANINSN